MKYCTPEMEQAYSELTTIEHEFISCIMRNDWFNAVQSMWEFINTLKFHKDQMPEEDVKRKIEMATDVIHKIAIKHWQESKTAFFSIFSNYPENQPNFYDFDFVTEVIVCGNYLRTKIIKGHVAMIFEFDGEETALKFW